MTDEEQKMDGENSPPIFCCTLPFQNVFIYRRLEKLPSK